jgi:DNA-binding winged helix-turn-helix (wHTH) protein/tetratricopeptide (TPR) repeat protein
MKNDDSNYIYEIGSFSVVLDERRLLFDGKQIALTPKAFDILLILIQHSGHVLEKKEIMDQIWPDTFVEEATLAQNIFILRKALGENAIGVQYIETIPKRGYRFVGEVKKSYLEPSKPQAHTPADFSSIAILPFDSLLTGSNDEYLGLGLADALISKLGNIRQIVVRPTRAVRKYIICDSDPIATGKELAVDLVLTGSIQLLGNKIRVTVHLIRVNDSTTLWSEKFDDIFEDILSVQDSISEQIIKILTLKLTAQEKERVTANYTNDSEAYLAYLKGRFYWGKWTQEGFEKGVVFFQQAVKIDPDFALAHAAIADAYNTLSFYGYLAPKPAFLTVNHAALQAIQIAPNSAEAHTALAINNFAFTWDWAVAEREFLRAIEINPSNPMFYHSFASFLLAMGRSSEATDNLKIALKLDPLSPLINASMAYPSFFSRQYDRAINELQAAINLEPHFPLSYKILGDSYTEKRMYEEANTAYKKGIDLTGAHPIQLAYLGRSLALSGKRQEAIKIIHQLKTTSNYSYVSPTSFAVIYAGLGEVEQAMDSLEESYRERCNNLVFINVQPAFGNLRSISRFTDLIQRMGFVSAPLDAS